MLSPLLSLGGVVGYVVVVVGMLGRGGAGGLLRERRRLILLGIAAAACHAFALWNTLALPEGIAFGVLEAGSALSLCLAVLVLLGSLRSPFDNLVVALMPIAALWLALATWLPEPMRPVQHFTPGLGVHVLSSLLAYSLFTLAAVEAVWLLVAERRLRARRPGWVLAFLPPLVHMEQLLFRLITAGFILLGLSLASGALYVEDFYAQHLMHKSVLSAAAWLVFALLLLGRNLAGWRGRTAVHLTLGGFGLLALAYFGSKVVLEVILGRT
jgi:ABC-type uncharacterized transport system permease subunit